jgi:hypothetical protein
MKPKKAAIIALLATAILFGCSKSPENATPPQTVNPAPPKNDAPVIANPSEKFGRQVFEHIQRTMMRTAMADAVNGRIGDVVDLSFASQDGKQITWTAKFKFVKAGKTDVSFKGRFYWDADQWKMEAQQPR